MGPLLAGLLMASLGWATGLNECDKATERLCEHKCMDLPIGYKCGCYEGYKIDPADPKACIGTPHFPLFPSFPSWSLRGAEFTPSHCITESGRIKMSALGDHEVNTGSGTRCQSGSTEGRSGVHLPSEGPVVTASLSESFPPGPFRTAALSL